ERLKDREEAQMETLQDTYNVPDEALEELETPMGYANYFIEEYRENMQRLGYGVDWRREFTTNDERYNKFIEWQYKTLREKGLLEKGKHPTKYCLNDQNPVTTHDLLEGEDVEKQEYTLVRFQLDQKILPMATLRPETVYGVTHALIHPDGDYVEARVDGETWIISSEAAEKLEHQNHDVKIQRELKGEELVGEELMNPVTGDSIMLLPATFVDTDSATGIVMSVPAHAPYDWISLRDLQENEEMLEEYGIDPQKVRDIEPISIIDVEGYGDYPAKEACEEHGITSQDDEEKLEEATELYENQNKFGTLWDFPAKVKCRCGGKVIVAKSETWFLRYGDAGWKDSADSCLNGIETIPDGTRDDFEHAINWLENWPCIRNYGLGTQMPFDEDFVIEPLSDSTIYMAYYTIRHKIRDIEPDKLTKEFFDYVFRGEGPVEEVAENTGVSIDRLKEIRKSFDYWYPLDWRTSANELIQTHLTFFMFHHAALFDEQHWPKGIATWGMGLLEGEKMSSSKGHVVLANKAIERYGADTVRFFMFSSCEPWQDFDWRQDEVEDYRNKLRKFYNQSLDLYGSGETREKKKIDHYVLSRLQHIIRETEDAMEDFQTRKASLKAFFELNNLITWYRKRSDTLHAAVINEVVETQIRLLAPFIPHLCEELWDETGHDGLVTTASWPEVDDDLID
ncbi:MAG: class I tRNA ligase family protein, partial [Candidatus Nanohaloarchaea archaeon]|nr:class I tRNA ligase family protein [Candidatus Nanohaloarchaea archaeon]